MGIKLKGSTSGSVEYDVPASITGGDINFTLPGADGTAGQVLKTDGSGALSFVDQPTVPPGLVLEWDQFQLSQDIGSDGFLTTWQRSAYTGFGQVGGQMTRSSAAPEVFTFPSTGYYLVIARPVFKIDGSDNVHLSTWTTTDNSTYTKSGDISDGNNGTGQQHGSSVSFTFVDVTDVANVKVKFAVTSIAGNGGVGGNNQYTHPETQVTFIRLGDT